jgi:hypothetical protein
LSGPLDRSLVHTTGSGRGIMPLLQVFLVG